MELQRVCMYLRKSRADLEAEARGEGETLAKHRKHLLSVAKKMNLNVIQIREEIVSGESIIDRPQVIELLREVENGEYDAVLVMDIDRLGRGDMIDQGTILRAFKASKTKIITTNKVYDLDNEFDEEYTEFEAFMARKEYKMINKRLQRGRMASVREGNYIGTRPPYGYELNEKVLYPHPEQAEIVKLIFDLYVNKEMGTTKIARHLNSLRIKSYTGNLWKQFSINVILKNEVYIGRIQWKKKDIDKKRGLAKTRSRDEWIDVQGKHQPLIDELTFAKAQKILAGRTHAPTDKKLKNSLAGLVKCGYCGMTMVLRPYTNQSPHIMCPSINCSNKSTNFIYVEQKVLEALQTWYQNYIADVKKASKKKQEEKRVMIPDTIVKGLERELDELTKQKASLHDLLERKVYDVETYLERSNILATRIEETEASLLRAREELNQFEEREKAKVDIIPVVEGVLKDYWKTKDPEIRNRLLKLVIDKTVYKKEKQMKRDEFYLELFTTLSPIRRQG